MSGSRVVAVLGLVLLVGFFLKWVHADLVLSGLDFARGWWQSADNQVLGVILFLAPVGALLLLILGALGKPHGLVAFFTGLICPVLLGLMVLGAEPGQLSGWQPQIGFWMTMLASVALLVMAFTKSDSKKRLRR